MFRNFWHGYSHQNSWVYYAVSFTYFSKSFGGLILTCWLLSNILFIVYSLKETGGTALGPALLLSTALASKIPGSQVNFHQLGLILTRETWIDISN